MSKRKESSKIFVIEVNSIVYFTVFILFLAIIIYFISLGMRNSDIKMELTKVYSQDQANAINALANSTVAKVNNIIATTAIFFTVIVASISVFQILKFRDFEKMRQSISVETINFKKSMEKLNEELIELKLSKEELHQHNVELEIEFTVFKIKEWFEHKEGFNTLECIDMINKVIDLGEKYTHLIKDDDLANMYYFRAIITNNENSAIRQENILSIKKAMLLIDQRNVLITRKYCRRLMYLCYEPEEKEEQLQEILEFADDDIEDIIWSILTNCSYINSSDEFLDVYIDQLKQLEECYRDYALKKIKEKYDSGAFIKIINTNFNNKLKEIINKKSS